MAVGKNKKAGKSKKGGRKKATDPFLKKEWYDVRTPSVFPVRSVGRTLATKTQGIKIARDTLLGRIFEVSQGDLKEKSEDEAFRKFRLRVEDVNGFNCLTQFHGMELTTDKLRSLVRKWQTLIEAHVDIRTSDGFALRLFAMGFTKRHKDQTKKTSYATASQVRTIRKKMREVMSKEGSGVTLDGLVEKLMIETIGKEIEKHTQAVYPLQHCMIRKVKMLRTPKIDAGKLLEAHGGAEALAQAAAAAAAASGAVVVGGADTGVKVEDKDAKADAKAAKKEDKAKDAKADAKASKKEDKGKDAKADKPAAAAKPAAAPKAAGAKPAGGDKKGGDKPKAGEGKKGGDKGKAAGGKKMDTSSS